MEIAELETSILLARIIGPLFWVVGLGFLVNLEHYTKMLVNFLENSEMYYFSGTLAFIIGMAMVLFHNLWVADWRLVITVIGWMSLFKGVGRIIFPNIGLRVARNLLGGGNTALSVGAGVMLILGVWLSYQGFGA